jgi:hypothetical protein
MTLPVALACPCFGSTLPPTQILIHSCPHPCHPRPPPLSRHGRLHSTVSAQAILARSVRNTMSPRTARKREPEDLNELQVTSPPTKKQRESAPEPSATRPKMDDDEIAVEYGEVHATNFFLTSNNSSTNGQSYKRTNSANAVVLEQQLERFLPQELGARLQASTIATRPKRESLHLLASIRCLSSGPSSSQHPF